MDISLLENVRCAVSFLFELDLWLSQENPEELYLEHYGKLGLAIEDPMVWALDSFRSVDPVYIHNYVLGSIAADQIVNKLESLFLNQPPQLYGRWLEVELYSLGRQESWPSKLERLG